MDFNGPSAGRSIVLWAAISFLYVKIDPCGCETDDRRAGAESNARISAMSPKE